MDEIDEVLLNLLRENSRLSLTEIANKLGISVPAAKYRLQKLERKGIIKKYSIEIDYEKLGYGIIALVGVSIEPLKRREVIKTLLEKEGVLKIYEVTGEYDIILKIVTENISTLREFLTVDLGNTEGVLRTYTMVIVREYDPFYGGNENERKNKRKENRGPNFPKRGS